MDNQQQDLPWSPHTLRNEESLAAIKTTAAIRASEDRIYNLAASLAYNKQPISEQDAKWLLGVAYAALLQVDLEVSLQEYRTQQWQELSQRLEELQQQPIPLYEPEPLPEWLKQPWEGV